MKKKVHPCDNCGNTKFGLVRYRKGMKVFCKKKCLEEYRAKESCREFMATGGFQ